MLVVIILVNYNGAKNTIECIHSLEKVENIDYEIIVVDNCSTDDSFDELQAEQQFHDFKLIKATTNDGFSAGNNIGIRYALKKNADYVLLLNNDTLVEPNFIKHLLEGFKWSENCGATIGKILYYSDPHIIWYAGGTLDHRTARTTHFGFFKKNQMSDMNFQKVSFASGCCLCLSNELIRKIGLLNEDFFLYEEDVEYCYRIVEAGFDIIYVPNSIIYHKVSASTGQGSAMSQYYAVRNKYYFIHRHYKGINKIVAYLYCSAQFLFRCMKQEQNFKYYVAGVKAYLQKETGKAKEDIK